MSLKNYFAIAERVNSVSGLTGQQIGGEVESVGYHEQDIKFEQRMIPRVDFSKPENFARYGLASEYYDGALKRIYGSFPYDGSRQERLEWENESLDIDLYIYENLYPRTNGYIIFSAEGWGTGNMADGYGSSSTNEYIHFYGGPHANDTGFTPYATKFTGSNYYEPAKNRESNLKYDIADNGVSVEFWLKKKSFLTSLTRKEVIFDLWNGQPSSSADYGRLRIQLTGATSGLSPFRVTLLSGSTGIYDTSVGAATFTSASVADDKWHHYGFTFKSASAGLQTRFYVDGELNNEVITGSGFQEVTGALQAYIGALIAAPSASTALAGYGKMSASLDEFRYWKTQRSSKGIGRYWFTQVGGGTNTDPEPFVDSIGDVNTLLGVYFKFNEGITGVTSTDRTVLDYSGRITNGSWTGYTPSSRNTGSAIVISAAAIKEYKDPIIYNFHPAVVALSSSLEISGSDYDAGNAANIYNSIPQWIREEDEEGQNNARYLTQIMASYFDDFQLKARALTDIKSVEYPSGSQKPLPFAERLLNSHGFVAPDIFLDADILEKLADRSEFRVYEKTLNDIKNTIYQNIYNNLSYIYKTKGTEKSFRNLIRCFGIDDELVKINLYANDVEAEMRSNRKNVAVPDKFVNFNTETNLQGTVVQFQNPSNTTNTAGYISGSGNLRNGYAFTLEAEVLFPQKISAQSPGYQNTNIISASLFGVHGNAGVDEASPRWPSYAGNEDVVNFQVYAVRDEVESDNVRFMLTGTSGLTTVVPRLSSQLFEDVYTDMNWNLAVRVRPESYPYTNVAGVTPTNYVVELHGINVDAGVVLNEFTVTGSLLSPGAGREYAFVTGSRRVFAGAHRTNFTGALRTPSDVKLNSCRYWLTYLDDATLAAHGHDTANAGTLNPHFYAFPFNSSASFGEVVDFDTLAFNWEFSTNSASNASGQFTVADESSGSNAVATATNGWLGSLLNQQYSARGFDFAPSSTTVIDKDYVIAARQTLPENIYSTDMVTVYNEAEQEVFQIDSRPINYYFAFEKSLYQNISEEILNYFATLKDLNTLIGAPVNRYRQEYKGLKFLREKFFATVANDTIDFDKFYEFYKWFDSALTVMLQQLVPASTDFASNVRTMIESHVLERSKYQSKFPFLESKSSPLIGATSGTGNDSTAMASPEDFPAGTSFFSNTAYTRRQIGSSNVVRTKQWQRLHAPPDGAQDKNTYWWRLMADRAKNPTLTGSIAATNNARQELLAAIDRSHRREANAPARFGAEGSVTLGGIGFHPNKRPSFVMDATAPAGSVVPGTNLPVNIMLSFQDDVEQLIDTKDIYYPSLKQRLGFGINPDINRGAPGVDNKSSTKNRMDGNVLAPFSLYSSSVKTGFNQEVISMYHSGVTITNLHHDVVHTNDIPMQGPFTEKYVGGWQYRHQPLNAYNASNPGTNYLDDRATRAEGWMLKLGLCEAAVSLGSGALGIVGPQYPDPSSVSGSAPRGYLFDRPKANLAREEYAKRPVNIRNIRMTTGSTIIGNYEHNYQVVQTTGRELNDPYFNDQSFNFAPYPETLATRGRFPLFVPLSPGDPSSVLFEAADETYIDAGNAAAWNTAFDKSYLQGITLSCWFNATTAVDTARIWSIGQIQFGITRSPGISFMIRNTGAGGQIVIWVYGSAGAYCTAYSNTFTNGVWNNLVVTIPPDALNGGGDVPKIYMNGVDDTSYTADVGSPDWTTLSGDPLLQGMRIGDAPTVSVSGPPYDGYLCDVAVWQGEGDAAAATSIYNGGVRPVLTTAVTSIDIISWHKLGNGLNDSTGGNFYDTVDNTNFQGSPFNFDSSNGIRKVSPTVAKCFLPCGPLNSETANPGGALNYLLPSRTGSNSQHTVFVNRFAGSGYEVMSLGYMDPAHEALSVYNALPYHNLSLLDYGLSGSASADPIAAKTITVIDQIGKNRGLDQRATLHCGQFGHDAAYGSVPASTYVTTPSWHKTNRNPRKRIVSASGGYITGTVYDNLYVQHPIPRSTQQYSWITASLATGYKGAPATIFGLESPSCTTANSLTQLVSGASYVHSGVPHTTSFTPLNLVVKDSLNTSTHIAGTSSVQPLVSLSRAQAANALNLARNGAYGYPSWKQIRVGESPMARALRKANKIGVVLPPAPVPKVSTVYSGSTLVGRTVLGFEPGIGFGPFVDYTERPVVSHARPVYFTFQDNTANSNPANNIALKVSYGNILDYFTNEGLNNRLNLGKVVDDGHAYNTIANFAVNSGLSLVANYGQRIYPAAINAYSDAIRSRTEFSIKNIWNDLRSIRSSDGGLTGSMGFATSSQSIWPMDGHNNFTATSSVLATVDGAGELQPNYTRFTTSPVGEFNGTDLSRAPGPCYAYPINLGSASATEGRNPVIAGDVEFVAHKQSGLVPYHESTTYNERMRLAAKDYSILPEFRVSEHMPTYIDTKESDFLANLPNLFSLTGAAISSSAQDNFFKVYSNADFLKYFRVVDNDLQEQRSGDLTITRDKLSLSCKAFLKLLPYKGFFPLERSLELSSLFSQSLGTAVPGPSVTAAGPRKQLARIPYEIMFAPGILNNTIKSGLGVSHFCMVNSASAKEVKPMLSGNSTFNSGPPSPGICVARGPEGNFTIRETAVANAQSSSYNRGYVINRVPFEALYKPESFFNISSLANLSGSGGTEFPLLYDTAPSQSHNSSPGISSWIRASSGGSARQSAIDLSTFRIQKLYTLAIDNFLCAASDLFVDKFSSFVSAREDDFQTAQSGSVYTMRVKLSRTQQGSKNVDQPTVPDYDGFDMYRRSSAFGAPIVGYQETVAPGVLAQEASYMHVTPPYYGGQAEAEFVFTASYDGRPALTDILGNLQINYLRQDASGTQTYVTASGYSAGGSSTGTRGYGITKIYGASGFTPGYFGPPSPGIMHLDACYNFTEALPEVVSGTTEQKFRWMIQSKFETPILNVQSSSVPGGWSPAPPTSFTPDGGVTTVTPNTLRAQGLWHQFGRAPSAAQEGVFVSIQDSESSFEQSVPRGPVVSAGVKSLARLVGFDTGKNVRVGSIKKEFRWEEAVVAIPFETVVGKRKFVSLLNHTHSEAYRKISRAMSKYNFPPGLDFTKFSTVDPILMYIFEFSADMSQQDLANIWQNLLPEVGNKFSTSEVVVEEKEVLDLLLQGNRDIEWMVFKVKKRVAIDFERQRRSLETSNTASMPVYIQEKYSYNWPYDYCSLVELAQIEESVQWSSRDLHTQEPVVIDYEPPTPDTTPGPSAAPIPMNMDSVVENTVPPLVVPPELDAQAPGEVETPPTFNIQKAKPLKRKAKSKRHKGKGKKR